MKEILNELKENLFPREVTKIFGISITDSAISGFVVVALLLIVALIIRVLFIPRFKNVPTGFQMLLESLVEMFDNMSKELTGHLAKFLGPYTFGAAAYICFGVLIEMTGLRPVMADLNSCLALALSTFILINFCGLKEKGLFGRLKRYINPINIISDLAVPVSMTFRLFGSILSGMVIMELVYGVMPYVLPAILSPIFTLFHAFIQSYIFAALSLTFVSEATE